MNSTLATTAVSSPGNTINALLESNPGGFGFKIEEIEEIVQNKDLRCHLDKIDEGYYLDNFLVSFNWWLKIAHVCIEDESEVPRDETNGAWDALVDEGLVTDIMSLFSVAYYARYGVAAIGSDPTGLELVKRYWSFRALVCSFVRRYARDARLDELLTLI